jgi:hypothetical protein
MAKLALLPVVIFPAVIFCISAILTWATARYMALATEQRARAAMQPRSRPYATTLPDALWRR